MGEKKWYVLRTAGGKEKKAKEYLEKEIEKSNLQNQVNQVLVPVEKKYTVKNGKRVSVQYIIRNMIPGMSGFLTENRAVVKKDDNSPAVAERIPIPLRDEEVRRILGEQDKQADSEGVTEVDYNIGDSVKITDGPFSGFDGTIDEIVEDRSKLKVIVMIFGRKTLLELNFNQVTKE